jgi:hypothetical protein
MTEIRSSSPPSTGAWLVGDWCANTGPSGGILGWVCTVAGSPGTWQVVLSGAGVGYNGFVSGRTDTTLTWTRATRTITITPTGPSFQIAAAGVVYTKTATSLQIPDTNGLHYIYWDASGTLVSTTTFAEAIITEHAIAAAIYWNAALDVEVLVADERHSVQMDPATHIYLHRSRGAALDKSTTRFGLTYDTGGNGSQADDAQVALETGTLIDEDLVLPSSLTAQVLTLPAQIPVVYKSGASASYEWRIKAADSYPLVYAGTVSGYTGARCAYNQLTGGSWQLTELGNNGYALIHLFAWDSISSRIVAVLGQTEYGSAALARAGAETELISVLLSGLPALEMVPLYSLIFQTATAYGNAPKARWQPPDTGTAVDWREIAPRSTT